MHIALVILLLSSCIMHAQHKTSVNAYISHTLIMNKGSETNLDSLDSRTMYLLSVLTIGIIAAS